MRATLYRQVANDLIEDIQQGRYEPGTKVPSVRMLSRRLDVSISTISQAYALLEDQGYIRSRPQSGYFVREQLYEALPPTSKGEKPSDVTKSSLINQLLKESASEQVINLGTAVPDLSFLPLRSLQTHIQKVTRFNRNSAFSYHFSPGLEGLRKVIAQRMLDANVRALPNDIVITNGATEAINLSLRACTEPGDIIAIESPCYYGYLQVAKQQGLKVIEIPTDPHNGISLDALKLSLQQWPIKAVLLSSRYSNPTGSLIPRAVQQQLYRLISDHQVPLIEDDVYGDLGHADPNNTTIKSFDDKGLVLYCSSFSKTLSPGLRVGWCLPGKARDRMIEMQMYSHWASCSLSQLAVESYLRQGHYDKHLRQFRSQSAENMRCASTFINQHFPGDTLVTSPKGGFILWLRLPAGIDTLHLYERAFGQGISLAPGGLFSNTDHFDNYLRINCALPWEQQLKPALLQVKALVMEMMSSVG